MFEVPDSKRVRRDELFNDVGNDGDAPSDAEVSLDEDAEKELRRRLNAQLSGLLDFDITAPTEPVKGSSGQVIGEAAAAEDGEEEPDELAFEFRLFRDEAPSHTVVIQQNEDKPGALGAGGFVMPRRPDAYYIAEAPDAATLEKLRYSAVSSDHLLADAGRRRWGLERPWRVLRISVSGKPLTDGSSSAVTATADDADAKKKRRPGKKRRIVLRTRAKAEKEKAEAARKFLESKEEHLKAKKQRLNREKKLKRRAKDKEKKAAAGATGDSGSVAGQGADVEMADDISDGGSAA
ncbi:hypothetical protein PFICI_09470 [Pestalotiopsis fici W106-1]|uniref:Uncharacterized protein n=1 Tax=Pestalotiopsis fici (strain W106-1 / CGMCC3.15140) TaxID=1229662 RepID=W3X2J2_PESFW|nr:uncharacterized protein PFICI_09470 [Pestalotiopsis fici W106-1]ETS79617.1 hypothetical protein PFICI_09470 [Pestalotiopsis fici W106-1]